VAVLPRSGPGRLRTCNDPGKNRELCRVELRSRDVTGRDRTCDAPRFKRALYRTELRSRTWAEPESNRRPPPHQRGALPPELSAYEWARLGSNQRPPLCKRGALPVELHARVQIRDKESNLDLHVQSVVSCRLDDPGTRVAPLSVHLPLREIDAAGVGGSARKQALSCPMTRSAEAERCFPCHSPTLRPWISDRPLRDRRPTWRSFGARASRSAVKSAG
jgi:hypothetical protein